MSTETRDEQRLTGASNENPESGKWALASSAVGLVIFPLLWGGLAGELPYMQEFRTGDREYWIWFAAYVMLFQWTVFAAFLFCLKRSGRTLSEIGFPVRWRELQVALIAVTAALLVVGAVLVATARLENAAEVPAIVPETLRDRIVMILLLAPTAAIVEETIFRGFALTFLPRLFGGRMWVAVIVSALLFSMMHGDWREPGLTGAFNLGYRFVFALIFSGLFLWRRSLKLPIALHWFVNGTSALTP